MQNFGAFVSKYGVENHGITNPGTVYWNLTGPMLYEQVVRRREGAIVHLGPLVVQTGDHTGRSPNDKFIVREPTSEQDIWWGVVNRSMTQSQFDQLYRKMRAYIQNRDIFVFDGYAGADPAYRMRVRVINEYAWLKKKVAATNIKSHGVIVMVAQNVPAPRINMRYPKLNSP